MAADASLSPELIEAHAFTSGFRGYDQAEVRDFLRRVAAEVRALKERADRLESAWHSAEERAARPPVLDEETLIAAVGEETASILRAARGAASDLRTRAAAEAERILADAQARAGEIRTEAEAVLGRETKTAEEAASRVVEGARSEAAEMVDKARAEADAVRAAAQHERNLTVEGAIATRERILDDLSRRRRVASVQIEQLRAGRERLLESYGVVRRTLEEVNDELNRADAEARAAADEVGRRLQREHHLDPSRLAEARTEGSTPAPGAGAAAEVTGEEGGAEAGEPPPPAESASPPPGDPPPDRPAPAPAASSPGSTPRQAAPPRTAPGAVTGGAEALAAVDPDADAGPQPEAAPPPRLRVVSDHDPTPAGDAPPAAGPGTQPSTSGGRVDVLFARIRAGRTAMRTHPADVELRAAAAPTAVPVPVPVPVAAPVAAEPVEPGEPIEPGQPADPGQPVQPGHREERRQPDPSDPDEVLLRRRQAVLADLESSLTRKLKRALQDEQNDLLDRLRSLRGEPTVVSLLPGFSEQMAHYAEVAQPLLEGAARAGVAFAAEVLKHQAGPDRTPAVDDLADETATTIVESLRRRLEHAISTSAGDEQQVLIEAVGSAYREWKSERIERIAGDVLAAAFSRGTWHRVPEGGSLRWVVKDIDGPCPDCDDDALAGSLPKGEPFPTGQPYPPAHPGCRCLLAPVAG